MFDIISKHPDWGPKLISYELRTDAYGKEKVDPDLIYSELQKLRLNTQELRERFVQKGGKKKRLKQPGTPLMTLDGKVILNFESAEMEVAKQQNTGVDKQMETLRSDTAEKKPIRRINIYSSDGEEKSKPTYIHKTAKPYAPVVKEKPASAAPTPAPEPIAASAKKEATPKKAAVQPTTKEELLKKVKTKVKQDEVSNFYQNVKGDLKQVQELINKLPQSPSFDQDIRKAAIVMKIVGRHPSLKKLPEIKQVFEQLFTAFNFMDEHIKELDKEIILTNVKDLLKYIEKDNKFKDYGKLFESINKIGLIQRSLEQSLKTTKTGSENQFDKIREKILNKNMIENTSLLELLSEDKKKNA